MKPLWDFLHTLTIKKSLLKVFQNSILHRFSHHVFFNLTTYLKDPLRNPTFRILWCTFTKWKTHMLDDDMKKIISTTVLCFAATVNKDGTPNLSPKSSLKVYDNRNLIFANMASPQTVNNLIRNPAIEINCVDIFSRRGYGFSGAATIHNGSDPIYTTLKQDIAVEHGDAIPVFDAIMVQVSEVRKVVSPAYTFIDGVTEELLRKAYYDKYEVKDI